MLGSAVSAPSTLNPPDQAPGVSSTPDVQISIGKNSREVKVSINGQDVTTLLQRITIDVTAANLPKVVLHLAPLITATRIDVAASVAAYLSEADQERLDFVKANPDALHRHIHSRPAEGRPTRPATPTRQS